MDYSGHMPEPHLRALPRIHKERSETHKLIDRVLDENQEAARAQLLDLLVKNPGVVATFNQDFVVEMSPMEVNTLDSEDRNLNEYRFEVIQKYRIRRRTEEDRSPLGRDSGGEARTD